MVFDKEHVARRIRFRQRKSEPVCAASEPLDAATRGLVRMGFNEWLTRRALGLIAGRHLEPQPIEDLVRDALSLLTQDARR